MKGILLSRRLHVSRCERERVAIVAVTLRCRRRGFNQRFAYWSAVITFKRPASARVRMKRKILLIVCVRAQAAVRQGGEY